MKEAGGMTALRAKSEKLTAYLAFWIAEINAKLGYEQFKIITPSNPQERGAQLSIIAKSDGKAIFDALVKLRIIGDWREPNVIRISPVPLYNTFEDVYHFGTELALICETMLLKS